MLLCGCAGVSPMQSGYMLGSIAGGIAGGPAGAAVGSAVGTLAGALVNAPIEQHRETQERKQLEQELSTAGVQTTPARKAPPSDLPAPPAPPMVVARVWVDERVEQGRVMSGHFEERRIPSPASGSPEPAIDIARTL